MASARTMGIHRAEMWAWESSMYSVLSSAAPLGSTSVTGSLRPSCCQALAPAAALPSDRTATENAPRR